MTTYTGYKPYIKGKQYENRLVQILRKHKFFVIRSPASGKRSKFYTPDIVAIKNGKSFLIECKYKSNKKSIYLEQYKYKQFKYLLSISGARGLICVYYLSIGEFRCLDANDYDKITDKYVEYSFHSFKTRGVPPEKIL